MKKIRFLSCLVILFTVIMSATAVYQRATYTDNETSGLIWSKLQVYPADDSLVDTMCQEMEELDKNSSIILKVLAIEEPEIIASQIRQKVRVEKVFCDKTVDGPSEKMEIYIIKQSNMVFYSENFDDPFASEYVITANTGFSNFMKTQQEYLVYLSRHVENITDQKTEGYLTAETMIMSLFSYTDSDRYAFPEAANISENSVYYSEVKDNEFFTVNEESYQRLMDEKHKLLEKYSG